MFKAKIHRSWYNRAPRTDLSSLFHCDGEKKATTKKTQQSAINSRCAHLYGLSLEIGSKIDLSFFRWPNLAFNLCCVCRPEAISILALQFFAAITNHHLLLFHHVLPLSVYHPSMGSSPTVAFIFCLEMEKLRTKAGHSFSASLTFLESTSFQNFKRELTI